MAFTVTASSVKYTDDSAGASGRAIITGSVVLDGGTTSGVLNPVTISALSGIQSDIVADIAGCREILFATIMPTSTTDTVQAATAYDPTTDSDQVTATVGTANTNIDFKLECRKTA